MKTCTKCLETKPLDLFPKEKNRGVFRIRADCKECRRKAQQQFHQRNPEYSKRYNKKQYAKNKNHILAHRKQRIRLLRERLNVLKASPCKDCGECFPPYCMDFDHRDPSGKITEVSKLIMEHAIWPKIEAEISKCDLVCANCHHLRTYQGANSYKTRRFERHFRIVTKLKETLPCLDCNRYFKGCQMEFDHIKDKSSSISQILGSSEKTLVEEIQKCHLICTNCHRKRTHTKIRPDTDQGPFLVERFYEIAQDIPLAQDKYLTLPWQHLLGTMSDTSLAKQVGESHEMVGYFRRKLGIPAARPVSNKPPSPKPWHSLLGTMSDAEIGKMFNKSSSTIMYHRHKLGIPAYRKV